MKIPLFGIVSLDWNQWRIQKREESGKFPLPELEKIRKNGIY